jgi:uncharacterized membrane protein YheB (UPF0754 family)
MESTIDTGSETSREAAREAVENQKKEMRSEKTSADFPNIKIQLPREAAIKIQAALQVLKERKADTKADELLAEFLETVTDDYLDLQIEKRTPEDYYFEAAKTIPDLREKIIQQTKKALQRTDKTLVSLPAPETKKARKKEKASDSSAALSTGTSANSNASTDAHDASEATHLVDPALTEGANAPSSELTQ